MAKSKSYRKFIATSATATLVATAVAPIAGLAATDLKDIDKLPKEEQEAIQYLVDKGVIEGKPGGLFDPFANMKRAEVAKVLVELNGLKPSEAAAGFNDIKGHWAEKYINAAAEAGLMIGKGEGKFDPEASVKRAEIAQALVRAYNLEKVDGVDADFPDVDSKYWGANAIDIMFSNGLITGKTEDKFAPEEAIQRNHVALMVYRTDVKFDIVKLNVNEIRAINGKTLVLEGTGLDQLKAEAITVEGSKVLSIKASEDGKSARVELETALNPGQEYKVTVEQDGKTKSFTVKYTFDVHNVAITTTTVDEDTEDQQLALAVNGSAIDLDTLVNTKGWDVEFQADKDVFKEGKTSKSGIIDETKEAIKINNTFDVKVVIKKEGVTVESSTVTVKVVSNVTPAVGNIVLQTNETGKLNSSTISLKDSSVIVEGVYSSTGDVINISGDAVYTSSNPAVASIDKDTGAITPLAPGKTTITVQAGKEVFTKEITVVNEARVATKAAPKYSTLAMAKGKEQNMPFTVTDQFGDKVAYNHNDLEARTSAGTNINVAEDVTSGSVTVEVPSDAKDGNYTVYIYNANEAKNIGQFNVNVSDANTIASYKFVPADGETIDLANLNNVIYTVDAFNQNGGYLETLTGNDLKDSDDKSYTVEVADERFAQVEKIEDGVITITPGTDTNRTGSTDVILKKDGQQVAKTTVKVVNEQIKVTGIDWKAKGNTITNKGVEITFTDALNITELASSADPIVNGVKLSKATTSKVRVSNEGGELVLYLDKNDDGSYDNKDVILGTLDATLTEGKVGSMALNTKVTNAAYDDVLGTTALEDKGTITFRFTDIVSTPSKVITSTTLKVDVK